MLTMALAATLLLPLLLVLQGRWRLVLLFAIVVGFLQDPMRKMAPGEPVHFVLLVLVVVAIAATVPFLRGGGLRLRWLFHRDTALITLASVFMVLVVLQAAHALARWQSPVLPAIGLMFYFAPFFALWLGSRYASTLGNVETLMRVYSAMVLLMAVTVVLSFSGMELPLFEEVGGGVTIHTFDGPLETHIGLFRASEIAAWHLVTAACFITILGFASGKLRWIVVALVIALALVALTMLTGRRKVLALFAGFGAVYALMIWNMRGRSVRSNLVAGLLGTAFVVFTFLVFAVEQRVGETWASYLTRASTVWGDVDDRMTQLGFGSIRWAWNRGGFVGLGTGAAAQGAQHFGGGVAGGAGEGGLGKITVELGALGLLLAGLLLAALVRHFWRIAKIVRRQSPRMQFVFYGLLAWLATNLPVFMVASQAYGDPFILLMLGLSAGMLLAVPEMVQRMALRQQWAEARPVAALVPSAAEMRR